MFATVLIGCPMNNDRNSQLRVDKAQVVFWVHSYGTEPVILMG